MRLVKLTVGKTKKIDQSTDLHYEVEAEVEGRKEMEKARNDILTIIDEWLKSDGRSNDLRGLDPERLNALPWRSFRGTNSPAGEGEEGWLFADLEDRSIEKLVESIRASRGGRVRLGGFEYALSGLGTSGKFVRRRPLKKVNRLRATNYF